MSEEDPIKRSKLKTIYQFQLVPYIELKQITGSRRTVFRSLMTHLFILINLIITTVLQSWNCPL